MKNYEFKVGDLVRYYPPPFRDFPGASSIAVVTELRSIGCFVLFVETQTVHFVTFRVLEPINEEL